MLKTLFVCISLLKGWGKDCLARLPDLTKEVNVTQQKLEMLPGCTLGYTVCTRLPDPVNIISAVCAGLLVVLVKKSLN